ncbi:nucleotidyltransferase domain-containing protein [Candidatus Woesearchaeota archaeon]|nr:nucleotidyltransferase domain-containing protein [Candidatus Woesearchaeota archaeon]
MDKKKAEILTSLKAFKKKNKLDRMYFFGSLAGGKGHRWSDIDLVVVANRFRGKGILERAPKLYLAWDLKFPVDFLCYTPEEFNKLKKQVSIVREAVKEGIEI